jgi:hypothetical protein
MDLSVASHVVPFDSHFSATMPNNDDMEADLSMFSFYTGKLGLSQLIKAFINEFKGAI